MSAASRRLRDRPRIHAQGPALGNMLKRPGRAEEGSPPQSFFLASDDAPTHRRPCWSLDCWMTAPG